MKSAELNSLDEKVAELDSSLEQWRRPSEPTLFETLRAIDLAFCEELFVPDEALEVKHERIVPC